MSCKSTMLAEDLVPFESLNLDERQAFVDHIWKEIHRHAEDINRGRDELAYIEAMYGIKPRNVYVGKWIEVKKS